MMYLWGIPQGYLFCRHHGNQKQKNPVEKGQTKAAFHPDPNPPGIDHELSWDLITDQNCLFFLLSNVYPTLLYVVKGVFLRCSEKDHVHGSYL